MLLSCVPKSLFMLVFGFVFSSLAWSFEIQGIFGLFWIIPCFVLWGKCATRCQSYFLWFGYFLGVVNGLPVAAGKFFDLPAYQSYTLGITFWLMHAAILALPYCLYVADSEKPILSHAKTLSVIFLITLSPPLGFALWGNPLSISGALFPGASWVGLMVTTIMVVVITLPKRKTSLCLLALSLIFVIFCHTVPTDNQNNSGVLPISTNFASASFSNPAAKFERHQQLYEQYSALDKSVPILFFPENILGRFNNTDLNFHRDMMQRAKMQSTVIMGVHRPLKTSPKQYYNSLAIIRNDQIAFYNSRLAMPVGNYNPFSEYSAEIAPFGKPVKKLSYANVAFHICYEGSLAWSILHSMWYDPDLLLFANNVWWAEGTNLPVAITRHETVWARLFGLPYAIATNF